MTGWIIAAVILWVVCLVLVYGLRVADSWYSFQSLQQEPGRFRDVSGNAAVAVFLGFIIAPIALVIEFGMTGFGRHGLMYRRPR